LRTTRIIQPDLGLTPIQQQLDIMQTSAVETLFDDVIIPNVASGVRESLVAMSIDVPMTQAISSLSQKMQSAAGRQLTEVNTKLSMFGRSVTAAIADEAGLEIEILNVAWDPLLAGMAQCQYDVAISAMTITEERKEAMLFSNPYFEAGQLVTVRYNNTDIKSKEDLGGKTVGAQIGTTGSFEVEKIAGATLKTYDDIGLAMQDLMNGQIDAVISDNPLAMGYANANPDKLKTVGAVFTSEYYGIAVCKDKPEILEKINEGLAKVKAEGLIDALILEWLAN